MKNLILCYSYGGNTKRIAEMIQKKVGGDIFEIETAEPYTGSYNEIVDRGQREVNSGFMPKIKPLSFDAGEYDKVFLGTPVWWYTYAPAVKTFLHEYDLSGKDVFVFATNGGWIGHTFEDFKKALPKSSVKGSINIRFDEHRLRTSEKEIENWALKAVE